MKKKEKSVPIAAMSIQILRVNPQPNFSESSAIPYVKAALPIYVLAFMTPDAVDTLPYFLKQFGTKQTSITFTPCIQPVKTAEQSTENIAATPESNDSSTAANVAAAKSTPEHVSMLSTFF